MTAIRESEDGTVTLFMEAVCDTVICNNAVITHERPIRFAGDSSFQYLGNEIIDSGIDNIPEYQFRNHV